MDKNAVDFYRRYEAWVIDFGLEGRIEYFRCLNPKDIDKQRSFDEYVHVVLASGFKWSIVEQYKPRLATPLENYDIYKISENPEDAKRKFTLVFRHAGKINAIVDTAVRLSNWTQQ